MTEQMLLRLAMVLQNQAPTTLNKYICNLTEAVLLDYPEGISLFDLNNLLNTQFNLAFTEEEIIYAVTQKGRNRIINEGNIYKLTPTIQRKLLMQSSLSEELTQIIQNFCETFELNNSISDISSLLLRYFYYCFNSNVDNLMSLFEKHTPSDSIAFESSAEELAIINCFITWDNPKKDALVYRLIATCYEYCMLTIKKDSILSSELFKGKRFYLDANILFRMAGINNEERKTVTQGFIDHCRQAGIELYCTSATLDEVYRVITAQVGYIRGITGLSMPVSCEKLETINPSTEVNDFYRIYYNWCHIAGNRPGDFTSFNQYLLSLVQDTLSQLKIKQSSAFKVGTHAAQYNQQVDNLKNYKNTMRTWRHTSTQSAETDITNIMDTLTWRTGSGKSIWQTNDFIVSADQLLIGWSNDAYSGVPIVVLPSVWLSIILRFTGRTDDDYKSFCLFLTQRNHISHEDTIDPIQLLRTINEKTTQTDIKERIITEITLNKSQYSFGTAEEYAISADRAFDKVLEEIYGNTEKRIEQAKIEMQKQIDELKESEVDKIENAVEIQTTAEREKTIITLAKNEAANAVHVFRIVSKLGWIFYILAAFIVGMALASWIWEISPFYSWMVSLLPVKAIASVEVFVAIWGFFTIAITLLATAIKGLFSWLSSEERETRLYNRYYNKHLKIVSENKV